MRSKKATSKKSGTRAQKSRVRTRGATAAKKVPTVDFTVVVYVDGEEYLRATNDHVPAWAVDGVAAALVAQVDDPDLEDAAFMAELNR